MPARIMILFCFVIIRFAHFLISPLMLESSLKREIEAVDSGEFTVRQLCLVACLYTIHNYCPFILGNCLCPTL